MGVGKTTVCQILKTKLNNSVFLDGDWCWDMHPFQVTAETQKLVMENICYQMNNFIRCRAFDHIIFGWVMYEQSIIDDILSKLNTKDCEVKVISLICSEESLRRRLEGDIERGIRTTDIIDRSIRYMNFYEPLETTKINVSSRTPDEVAECILRL